MNTRHHRLWTLLASAGLALLTGTAAQAQTPLGTQFTYQGQLSQLGSAASGTYDLKFRLFDSPQGGNQVGPTLCSDNLAILNGAVTASLDFGSVFTGQKLYLEILVRVDSGQSCGDDTGFEALSPRQELTATPYASFAQVAASAQTAVTATNAANATTLGGQTGSFYRSAANLTGTLPNGLLSGTYSSPLTLSNPGNVFTGNGAGLTNLSAGNLVGVLDAARMPSNWAAGGDLSGFYPSPTIATGAVGLSKLAPSVQSVLSNFTNLTPAPTPLDAVAWGSNQPGLLAIPALAPGLTYSAVTGGSNYGLALRSDGQIVAWGDNTYGQLNVPALPPGVTYTAISANNYNNMALRSDGNVVAWPAFSGGTPQPALPPGQFYTAVAAGASFCCALRSDGAIVVWGSNNNGQLNVPALPPGVTYTRVGAGEAHGLAVRSDGVTAAWGYNIWGQANPVQPPPGVVHTALTGGSRHSLALRSDGRIDAWGLNQSSLLAVPALPPGVVYTAMAAGTDHSVALRSDRVIVAWGTNFQGQMNIPALPTGVTYMGVGSGQYFSLALRGSIVPPSVGTSIGLSVGLTTPPPGLGGISVAGSSSFASNVSAASFVGGGAGLTNLNAANIATGTLDPARIPSLDASKIVTGTLNPAMIPSLDASIIVTGTLDPALIPSLDASKIASGTINPARLPLLSASNITSGTLSNAQTTGTDAATPNTLVLRDASGNFSANVITATTFVGALNGNATSASNTPQLNFQPASYYTNASNISTGTLANARTTGTNLNTASTLVLRDASGNFSAGTITANLNGNAATATSATSAASATNATQLNGQPAAFYTNASNIAAGTLADARLSANVPLLNANNTFSGSQQTFAGASGISLTNGIIQKSGAPLTATTDLGLYSQIPGGWLRFVTNGAQFAWFSDSGIGTNARMILSASGNLSVTGTLSKGGGSFKIDHPLDPENKYLYHSFVESPDMMNVYNGNVTTDAQGRATITLPDYFEALNRDFRYQLTVIDEDSFALVRVSRKIAGNTFEIASSEPGVEVSWQVTGIRKDAWANKNRIPNAVDKSPAERGRYLHPEAFGKPSSQSVMSVPAIEGGAR